MLQPFATYTITLLWKNENISHPRKAWESKGRMQQAAGSSQKSELRTQNFEIRISKLKTGF